MIPIPATMGPAPAGPVIIARIASAVQDAFSRTILSTTGRTRNDLETPARGGCLLSRGGAAPSWGLVILLVVALGAVMSVRIGAWFEAWLHRRIQRLPGGAPVVRLSGMIRERKVVRARFNSVVLVPFAGRKSCAPGPVTSRHGTGPVNRPTVCILPRSPLSLSTALEHADGDPVHATDLSTDGAFRVIGNRGILPPGR